jgi:hypothetical protein
MKSRNLPIPGEGVPAYLAKYGIKPSEWTCAVKKGLGVLMRPGFDLRARIIILGQLHSVGYPGGGGEFCIMQAASKKGGRPNFVPLTPSAISTALLEVDIEDFRRSGKELTDEEQKRRKEKSYALPDIRAKIQSIEIEDGVFTAVTMTKLLSRDKATKERGWEDLRRLCGLFEKRALADGKEKWVQVTEGLSFDEARAQNLITPISELSKKQRQGLAGKSFLYCHIRPRPAKLSALSRRTIDDFTGDTSNGNGNGNGNGPIPELGKPVQLLMKFGRAHGVTDPKLAAWLAELPAVKADYEHFVQAEKLKAEAAESYSSHLAAVPHVIAEYHATGKLPVLSPAAVQAALPGLLVPEDAPPAAQPAAVQRPLPGLGATLVNGHAKNGATKESADPETGCAPAEIEGANQRFEKETGDTPLSQPRSSKPAPDWDAVGRAAAQYGASISDTWQRKIVAACQAGTADVTPAEIAQLIHSVGKQAAKKDSPHGWLLKVVPERCEGESFRRQRERWKNPREQVETPVTAEESLRDRAIRIRRTANG